MRAANLKPLLSPNHHPFLTSLWYSNSILLPFNICTKITVSNAPHIPATLFTLIGFYGYFMRWHKSNAKSCKSSQSIDTDMCRFEWFECQMCIGCVCVCVCRYWYAIAQEVLGVLHVSPALQFQLKLMNAGIFQTKYVNQHVSIISSIFKLKLNSTPIDSNVQNLQFPRLMSRSSRISFLLFVYMSFFWNHHDNCTLLTCLELLNTLQWDILHCIRVYFIVYSTFNIPAMWTISIAVALFHMHNVALVQGKHATRLFSFEMHRR